jgi:hypothetical protein
MSKDKIISTASTSKNNSKETSPLSPVINKTDFFDSNNSSPQSDKENVNNNALVKNLANLIFLGKNDEVRNICSNNFNLKADNYGDLLNQITQYVINEKLITDQKIFGLLLLEIETELLDLGMSTDIIDSFSAADLDYLV